MLLRDATEALSPTTIGRADLKDFTNMFPPI
ncbi:hypothetical protein [Escherichia phage BI-EHEC]|nr:hypothetical protein [Escherichia phage BI-EHEC]